MIYIDYTYIYSQFICVICMICGQTSLQYMTFISTYYNTPPQTECAGAESSKQILVSREPDRVAPAGKVSVKQLHFL